MMISPDTYYEKNLKGKDEKQILSKIRGLKNKIGHLKKVMEQFDYDSKVTMSPDEDTRLSCNRLYLERAKQALAEVGGTYKLSKAEVKAADFQDNIPFIRKIVFEIGGFFGGYYKYTAIFENDMLNLAIEHLEEPVSVPQLLTEDREPYSKQSFLDVIKELNMGEWRHYYYAPVLDGTQWSIKIEYCSGHRPVSFSGSNTYPYNFRKLEELFGISNGCEEKGRFEILTKYIPKLEYDKIGDWVIDRENDGSREHPIHMPFVNYSKCVNSFIQDVYQFMDENEDMNLNHYTDILKENGLEWDYGSMSKADVSAFDEQGVMALIMGAVRAERFCDGALFDFFKDGCILRWLERLKEIDED